MPIGAGSDVYEALGSITSPPDSIRCGTVRGCGSAATAKWVDPAGRAAPTLRARLGGDVGPFPAAPSDAGSAVISIPSAMARLAARIARREPAVRGRGLARGEDQRPVLIEEA